jgi:ABC-2 type transport system permease protein
MSDEIRLNPGHPSHRPITSLLGVLLSFLRMNLSEELRYPMPFVLRQMSFLAELAVFYFVAQLIGDSSAVGGDYFTFVVIGIGVSRMLQPTLGGFGVDLQRAQSRGTLESWLVEPVSWISLPFAMSIWSIMVGVVSGLAILIVGTAFGARYALGGAIVTVPLLAVGLVASSATGILIAGQTVVAKRAAPVLQLYTLAASLLGGMLFPITLLPAWLRALSWLIPHTYVINAARAALMPQTVAGAVDPSLALLALALFSAIIMPLGLWSLSRWLQLGRRLGVLGGY